MTLTRSDVTALMARHGLRPSKALGQHFVVDPNTVRRTVRLAEVGPGDQVLEIGAGLGSLTLELAEAGARVVAVEMDRHLLPALREVVEPAGVTVVEGDAMSLDWEAVLVPPEPPWALVANLPYNVATPLVLEVLEGAPAIGRMLVMVQREVGERLAARPGDDAYGAVSVKVAWWAKAAVVGRVPPTVFLPPPKVESVLVGIERRPPPPHDRHRVLRLVNAAFGQRRKMLRRSLAPLGVGDDAFAAAGIRPEARPEEIALEEWGRLAACLA